MAHLVSRASNAGGSRIGQQLDLVIHLDRGFERLAHHMHAALDTRDRFAHDLKHWTLLTDHLAPISLCASLLL